MKGFMKERFVIFTSVVFLLISALVVMAANFNASVNPSTLNASSSQLLNFTISNTDPAQNIVKINITLPSGFTYGGNVRQDIGMFSLLENGRILSWENGSGLVLASSTDYLWFNVNCPQSLGTFGFNVSAVDTAIALTSENVTVDVVDIIAPKWSSNSTSPSTPTQYGVNKNYTFNVTWMDNVAINDIIFEWDSTTNYTNTTSPAIVNLGSGKYSITLVDLNVGYYTYKWYANDTNSTYNSTGSLVYNITKLDNVVNMYFNNNPNQDMTINSGTDVNITVTSYGTIYIYENEKLISSGVGPLTNIKTLSVGIYTYKANTTGTANYTTNSTGASYDITAIYPPPKYSISTNIPDTWYKNAFANFSVTWTDDNDPNGFNTAFIELNHTGTRLNYTMNRSGSSNTSFHDINITQPIGFSWRVYANNSYNTWNSSNLTFAEVKKITPNVSLTITPSLNVLKGTQTTAHCTSNEVSIHLYRNGVSVSTPDIQTLATDEYIYTCNSTATTNYTALSIAKILNVVSQTKNISFIQAESVITVKQGSTNSTTVIVKNTGAITQTITFSIETLDSSFYTLGTTSALLAAAQNASFIVDFNVNNSTEVKDYSGKFKATTAGNTRTSDFTLRVTPTEDTKSYIENTLALYKVNMTKVWMEINKSKDEGYNITIAESKILDAKEKIEQAETHIAAGDYVEANNLMDSIKSLIAGAETELIAAKVPITILPIPYTSWWIIGIVAVVVAALAYLLWPQPGYDPRKRRYRHKTPKQKGVEKIEDVKHKLKKTVFGKPYTSPFKYGKRKVKQPAPVKKLLTKKTPAPTKTPSLPPGVKIDEKSKEDAAEDTEKFSIEKFLKKFTKKKQ